MDLICARAGKVCPIIQARYKDLVQEELQIGKPINEPLLDGLKDITFVFKIINIIILFQIAGNAKQRMIQY